MKPEQALALLTQATAGLSATRKDHEMIQHALDVLAEAIAPEAPPTEGTATTQPQLPSTPVSP